MTTELTELNVQNASLPAIYASAKQALANCANIDECKEWADKASALASYARMSEDDTLEKHALRIRHRATRRAPFKFYDGMTRDKKAEWKALIKSVQVKWVAKQAKLAGA